MRPAGSERDLFPPWVPRGHFILSQGFIEHLNVTARLLVLGLQQSRVPAQRTQQHFSQQPGCASNIQVHQQTDGYIGRATYIQWNLTQPEKKKELMLFVATWMNLEIVIPSDVSQTEKDEYHMI